MEMNKDWLVYKYLMKQFLVIIGEAVLGVIGIKVIYGIIYFILGSGFYFHNIFALGPINMIVSLAIVFCGVFIYSNFKVLMQNGISRVVYYRQMLLSLLSLVVLKNAVFSALFKIFQHKNLWNIDVKPMEKFVMPSPVQIAIIGLLVFLFVVYGLMLLSSFLNLFTTKIRWMVIFAGLIACGLILYSLSRLFLFMGSKNVLRYILATVDNGSVVSINFWIWILYLVIGVVVELVLSYVCFKHLQVRRD